MSTIIIKNSSVPNNQPSTLFEGEIAINTSDGKIFYGVPGGGIKLFAGTPTFPYTGDAAITGTLYLTGSFNQIGDYIHTGSVYHTGSKYLDGIFVQTGSLYITGSTTQIGNNTLTGNTLLSGSIIISGSSSPGSPTASVKVYGDIETTGYHRFNPVTTNIDQFTSASYIYVSGSTNDLYFTQNGSGYSNTSRLRWLEGGSLYTGLLRGGVISSTPGSTTFKITSGSGLLVTMNASTGSEPFPTVQYISWPDYNAQPIIYSGSAKITYVGISSAGTVIQQTFPWGTNDINQWDNSLSLGVVLHLSGSVSTGVFNAPQMSYGGQQKTDDFFRAFGPLKISGHTLQASGSTLGLQKTGGTSYREGANYVINANHPSTVVENAISTSKIYRYHLSGSTPIIDTGVGNAGYDRIDPTQYVDTTTGQLTPVYGTNSNQWRWTIQRVFWVPNSPTNAFIVYYGNAEYTTLVDVKNAIDTEPFSEAPNTSQNAIFIGYILVRKGCTDLSDTTGTNAVLVQGGLFRNVGGNGGSGTAAATSLGSLSDVSLSNDTPGDLLVYGTEGEWNNKKQLTGSYGLTGSLTVTQNISASSFTGSLQGTASWANNATTASYVNNLNQNVIITGSLTIGSITGSQSNESTLNIYAPGFNTGGEGGQILLAAMPSASLYTTASMLDTYQDQFRVLRGTNAGGSNAGLMYMNLQTGNTQFVGAVTASAYSGLPNSWLHALRSGDQTIGSGTWANRDIIFNNYSSNNFTYNSSTGVATLKAGKTYRITARLAWFAAGNYTLQFGVYNQTTSGFTGPTVQMVQPTTGSFSISDGTLEHMFNVGASDVDITIRTTAATNALSGEYIRGDLNTQLIIQQIA